MNNFEGYENAVEFFRQALREGLKPEAAEEAIFALGELLSVAKQIGAEEAQEAARCATP